MLIQRQCRILPIRDNGREPDNLQFHEVLAFPGASTGRQTNIHFQVIYKDIHNVSRFHHSRLASLNSQFRYRLVCDRFSYIKLELPSFEVATEPNTMRSTFTLASSPTGLHHCPEARPEAATFSSCFEASDGGPTCINNPERRPGIGTNNFFLD
jgi:hypothetical protein